MVVNTADTQSSASSLTGSTQTRNANLLSTKALQFMHKAAQVRVKTDGDIEEKIDPLECWTVAFWEDLYNKVLLKGYSNNSQWPPNNQTKKVMDIGTFYYEEVPEVGFRRMALVFTEAKRARNATSKTPGETLYDLELQLADYCKRWLTAKKPGGTEKHIYANAVVGQYIRCFTATLDEKSAVRMTDSNDEIGCQENVDLRTHYMDVGNTEHQSKILEAFRKIRKEQPPEPIPTTGRPSTSSSGGAPSISPPGSGAKTPSNGSRKSSGSHEGSPMSVDSRGPSPPRRPRAGQSDNTAARRSESPRGQPHRSAVPIRDRSDPVKKPGA